MDVTIFKELLSNKELMLEIYGDLAKPGVKEVGKALATVLGLGNTILLPIHMLNEKSKVIVSKNLDKYRRKIEQYPEGDIIQVSPEIGVPVLEKLMYIEDDTLTDMFSELLAKSSNKEQVSRAHPRFVNVISGISPDEAAIIKCLASHYFGIAYVSVIRDKLNSSLFHVLCRVYTDAFDQLSLCYGKNLELYLDNLEALGVIEFRGNTYSEINQEIYNKLKLGAEIEFNKSGVLPGYSDRLSFVKKEIKLTSFGRCFSSACLVLGSKITA
ncbi:DUF4393 domain-containing protein [Vibrio cholerae]|nr:DUF4393 domain-containing protein [Vibrio cholerae]EKF9477967.1 DUF4393 domain-containing protein [Vibrio cholerae]ELY5209071.1 DUF4393 domain-containing protein [Vibrio cholerae]